MSTFYEILGVERRASLDEIKAAYRRLVASCQPSEFKPGASKARGKGKGKDGKGKSRRQLHYECPQEEHLAWLEIQKAFETLANPRRRVPYDAKLDSEARRRGDPDYGTPASSSAETAHDSEIHRRGPELQDLTQVADEDFYAAVDAYFSEVASHEPMDADELPACGSKHSTCEEVKSFYAFWTEWTSMREFTEDSRHSSDDLAGATNRQVRRLMESENEKVRRQAKKTCSMQVREAARHAENHDPRVKARKESQRLEDEARAAKREETAVLEAAEALAARAEMRRAARAADEERWSSQPSKQPLTPMQASCPSSPEPFFCQACSKGFRSRDAWLDHAASKKHRHSARRWKQESGTEVSEVLVESGVRPRASSYSGTPSMSPFHPSRPSRTAARTSSGSFEFELELIPDLESFELPEAAVDVEASLVSVKPSPWLYACDFSYASPRVVEVAVPTAFTALAAIPAHAWQAVLLFVGKGRRSAPCVVGLLSNSALRSGELGLPSLWAAVLTEMWGPVPDCAVAYGPRRFFELMSSSEEADELWKLVGGDRSDGTHLADTSSHQSQFTGRRTQADGVVVGLSATESLVAALTNGVSEVRLLTSSLNRLPPVRIKGKQSEAVALASDGEHLAIGSVDGLVSLYSTSDPDEPPVRLFRLPEPAGPVAFAGMQFLGPDRIVIAPRSDSVASLLDVEARSAPIATSSTSGDPWLLKASPLSGSSDAAVLLLDQSGQAKIWDLRVPSTRLAVQLGAGGFAHRGELVTAAVDMDRYMVAAASSCALYWSDIRAQRQTELPMRIQRHPDSPAQPVIAFSPGGSLLSWWGPAAGQSFGNACIYAGGRALVPVHDGVARSLPMATCWAGVGRSSSLIIALASQGPRRVDFELCSIRPSSGVSVPQHQMSGPRGAPSPLQRPSKQSPKALPRRPPTFNGPVGSRRRGGR